MVKEFEAIKGFCFFMVVDVMRVLETHLLSYLVIGQQDIFVLALGIALYISFIGARYILTKPGTSSKKVSKADSEKVKRVKYEYKYALEVTYTVQ